jgi:hypothetical protein
MSCRAFEHYQNHAAVIFRKDSIRTTQISINPYQPLIEQPLLLNYIHRKMGLHFSRIWERMFGKKEMRILMVGLDAAGKVYLLFRPNGLSQGDAKLNF